MALFGTESQLSHGPSWFAFAFKHVNIKGFLLLIRSVIQLHGRTKGRWMVTHRHGKLKDSDTVKGHFTLGGSFVAGSSLSGPFLTARFERRSFGTNTPATAIRNPIKAVIIFILIVISSSIAQVEGFRSWWFGVTRPANHADIRLECAMNDLCLLLLSFAFVN